MTTPKPFKRSEANYELQKYAFFKRNAKLLGMWITRNPTTYSTKSTNKIHFKGFISNFKNCTLNRQLGRNQTQRRKRLRNWLKERNKFRNIVNLSTENSECNLQECWLSEVETTLYQTDTLISFQQTASFDRILFTPILKLNLLECKHKQRNSNLYKYNALALFRFTTQCSFTLFP